MSMKSWHCLLLCLGVASADHLSAISHLDEVLFTANPSFDGSTYSNSWPGWVGPDSSQGWPQGATGYYGTAADGEAITYGKQVAFDAMCLGGIRFKEGNDIFATFILEPYWKGMSLGQITNACSYNWENDCNRVGWLYDVKGIFPADYLAMSYAPNPIFTIGYTYRGDEYSIGTETTLSPVAKSAVTIEGAPVMELLFAAYADSDGYSNTWPGWFTEGYVNSIGKQAAYDTAPLYTIRLEDEYGSYAEYIINKDYAGLCLLEIVQKCIPDAKAMRRNDGSQRWIDGHCEIGTLVSAYGLPGISDQLRLGVGDVEAATRVQYRDWALFMPLKGNGMGSFGKDVWAFGSKGKTNSGAGYAMVSIYGGPSLACGASRAPEPVCLTAGTRVMFDLMYSMYVCGTVDAYICDTDQLNGTYPSVTWDDGVPWPSSVEALVECQVMPPYTAPEDVVTELLFAADGMSEDYSNRYEGWFEVPGFSRRLEASEFNPGIQPAYMETCLRGVTFKDDSGAYATYSYKSEYIPRPLGRIVADCLPGPRRNRRNEDSPEWHEGHCMIGDLDTSMDVDNVNDTLRIGVGDGMRSMDPDYPDYNDWAVFMPVSGNAEQGFKPTGGGNFRYGVWAFGSKGVTNSLYDGPVYIYGQAYVLPLFIAAAEDPRFNNSFPGWYEPGYYISEDDLGSQFGKLEFYDTEPLSSLYFLDIAGNYAVYKLDYPFSGMTLLDIVTGCVTGQQTQQYDPCSVGSLVRFGGFKINSVSTGLRIGAGNRNMTSDSRDFVIFTPIYANSDFEENMVWSVGSNTMTSPGFFGTVYIFGGPSSCNNPFVDGP